MYRIILILLLLALARTKADAQSTAFERLRDYLLVSVTEKIQKLNEMITITRREVYFSNGSVNRWSEYWVADDEGLRSGEYRFSWEDINVLWVSTKNRLYVGGQQNSGTKWAYLTPKSGSIAGCEDIATLITWIMREKELGRPRFVSSLQEDEDERNKPQYIKDQERAVAREAKKKREQEEAAESLAKYRTKALAGDEAAIQQMIYAYNLVKDETAKIKFLEMVFNRNKSKVAKESLLDFYQGKMSTMKYSYRESRKGWLQLGGGLAVMAGTWFGANALIEKSDIDGTTLGIGAAAGIGGGLVLSIAGVVNLLANPNYKKDQNYLEYQRKMRILNSNGTLSVKPVWNSAPHIEGPGLVVRIQF